MLSFLRMRPCHVCGVYFEPHHDAVNEANFRNLCSEHLKPKRAELDRVRRIASWASCNLDKVEKLMREEEVAMREEMQRFAQSQMNALQSAAYQRGPGLNGLGGV